MKVKTLFLKIVFFALFVFSHSHALGIELCQADLNLGFFSYQTDHIWNKNGKKISTYSDFKLRAYQIYLDTYLSSRDCLSLKGSYIQIEDELNGHSRGFSDSELSWTHFFYVDGDRALAVSTTAIIPSGSQIYNLRYGEFGGQLNLLYSFNREILNRTLFFDSIVGYRIYRGFPSDQFRTYFSAGTYLVSKLYFEGSLDLQFGVFNGKAKFNYPLVLLNPNYRLLRGDLLVAYHVHENIYLSATVFQHLWGQNVGTGRGFCLEGWLEY